MSRINGLAIFLTRRIDSAIYKLCSDVTKADEKTIAQSPNFYQIRETILKTLEEYMVELQIYSQHSEYDRDYPESILNEIKKHRLESEAHKVVSEIMSRKDILDIDEYEDEYSRFKTINKGIVFVKTGMIEKEIKE